MEEQIYDQCGVVYFCAGRDRPDELFHNSSPPLHDTSDDVYRNVCALLDADQGGFKEVFLSNQAERCVDRLESRASVLPTLVLVEIPQSSSPQSPLLLTKGSTSSPFSFLRALSADIQGARYQRHVMPFALLVHDTHPPSLDPALTSDCLSAGAVDILHSPLGYEDMNRLVGHVKETTRPSANLLGASMAQNLVDSIRSTVPTQVTRHRLEEIIPPERIQAAEDTVCQWGFAAHSLSMDELTWCALFMLERMLTEPALQPYQISRPQLVTFLLATRRQYKHEREVHYHNWRHAVDVTQSIFIFLMHVGLCPAPAERKSPRSPSPVEKLLTPLDGLILLVSAIGHDVGHPGVNNAFLVASHHPLAQMYNDKSVLENYHCAAYSQLVRRHWPALSNLPSFRPTLISNVLATDMQRHFEYMGYMSDLHSRIENTAADLSDWSDKDRDSTRELMMALLMKAADISNVARPFDISSQWAKILMNEFARQGELESELDIPTCLFGGPPDKEDILAAAQSQKGFMSLFGHPLFSGMCQIMPNVSCAINELENNRQIWDDRIEQEKARRNVSAEEARRQITFSSVSSKEVEEAASRNNSEPTAVPAELSQRPSTPANRRIVIDTAAAEGRHAAHSPRQHLTTGVANDDQHRSSAPFLSTTSLLSPVHSGPSRRSSKDVALDQLQQLTAYAHQTLAPGSRRGSADAGWQIQRSYPSSRRGSKDESLTTILVTSQGSPGRRTSPPQHASSSKTAPTVPPSSPPKSSHTKNSMSQNAAGSEGGAMSWSHRASSATNTNSQQSTSTQPSSVFSGGEDDQLAHVEHVAAAADDAFGMPGTWPLGASSQSRTDLDKDMNLGLQITSSPKADSRESSHDGSTVRRGERAMRESRSRSRLRGLKFWKKKKESSSAEAGTGTGSSSTAS